MAVVISGTNNSDKITATDGLIDLLSSVNFASEVSVPSFKVGSDIQIGNAGIITATTLVGNVQGNINHTSNLLLQISGSEKFRVGTSGQLGIGGANYGTSGQVLTSGGSSSAATWSTITGTTISNNADDRLITGTGTANTINAEADLTFDGTNLKLTDHKNMYFGTGNDLRIWHDANNSYSQINSGQMNFYIDGLTTYMRSGNGSSGVENAIVMNNNASVDLYYSGTKKFATDSTGFYSTNYGDYIAVSSNGSAASGRFGYESNYKMYLQNTRGYGTKVIFDNDGKIRSQITDGSSLVDRFEVNASGASVTGTLGVSNALNVTGLTTLSDSLLMGDNVIAKFGTGSDLRIYHDGTTNHIKGTGSHATMFWTSNVERWYIDSNGHFKPGANGNYDIGASNARVRNAYISDLKLSNEGQSNDVDGTWGDWTLQEGKDKVYMINNRTGKKYSLKMEEE